MGSSRKRTGVLKRKNKGRRKKGRRKRRAMWKRRHQK